jgi:hypothetical protein
MVHEAPAYHESVPVAPIVQQIARLSSSVRDAEELGNEVPHEYDLESELDQTMPSFSIPGRDRREAYPSTKHELVIDSKRSDNPSSTIHSKRSYNRGKCHEKNVDK